MQKLAVSVTIKDKMAMPGPVNNIILIGLKLVISDIP